MEPKSFQEASKTKYAKNMKIALTLEREHDFEGFGRPKLSSNWPKFGPTCPKLAEIEPKVAQVGPSWQKWAQVA